ncbi:MAG: hypothetical protein WDZ77_00940 [Candidatus Pacearchaeota archaeon]
MALLDFKQGIEEIVEEEIEEFLNLFKLNPRTYSGIILYGKSNSDFLDELRNYFSKGFSERGYDELIIRVSETEPMQAERILEDAGGNLTPGFYCIDVTRCYHL